MLEGGHFPNADIIVTTMGGEPVLVTFVDKDRSLHQTAVSIGKVEAAEIVDTTGAGSPPVFFVLPALACTSP